MNNTNLKIEVLAPCGSYDILVAAVHAGADACYIGGNRFGARAYAENFDEEMTIRAISYAHLHGVKIYLTVNTLFKQNEIPQLYDYIKPYYEAGLDAVIVQDLGVFFYIRTQFPDLPVHCSTQMNITSVHGAGFMAKQGAKRVVTAREMSLDEIRAIKQQVEIEVETFVHGAMCYSYSGQCLMSSLAGGRSGNRGRCAQPCRKCYDNQYLLSMKDLCSLKHIPELLDAGVDSLKIEGRMKNASYVASAVHAYKTIVEDCQKGVYDDKKAEELTFELANIYNRGGFSDGYFFRHNGAEMISVKRPNNQGVCVGTVTNIKNGSVSIHLTCELYKQDVLELAANDGAVIEITSGVSCKKGEAVTLNCPKTRKLKTGTSVYRTKCPKLIADIENAYIATYKKQPISMKLIAKEGEMLSLEVQTVLRGVSYTASVEGDIVEKSRQAEMTRENIQKPLLQLGNTDYECSVLEMDMSPEAFVPAGNLKKLRRSAITKLEETILDCGKRAPVKPCEIPVQNMNMNQTEAFSNRLIIGVSDYNQLSAVLNAAEEKNLSVYGITMAYTVYESLEKSVCDKMKAKKIKCYFELPHVIASSDRLEQYLPKDAFGGIYIRNIDGLAIVADTELPDSCELLVDASLYCYNQPAFSFVKSMLKNANPVSFLLPRELSLDELQEVNDEPICMTVYEYQPVMVTANCIKRTVSGCDKTESIKKIRDDMGNVFFAKSFCNRCYNVLYNGIPFSILDKYREASFQKLHKHGYAIRFTIETEEEAARILSMYCDAQAENIKKTSGHLYRGVM